MSALTLVTSRDGSLLTLEVTSEASLLVARQRARQLASVLGFDAIDQVRIAAATAESARDALHHAAGARVDFLLETEPAWRLVIRVVDGPGQPARAEPEHQGPRALRVVPRLLDVRQVLTPAENAAVFTRELPSAAAATLGSVEAVGRQLQALITREADEDQVRALRAREDELLRVLEVVSHQGSELEELRSRIEAKDRGVLAVHAKLDEQRKSEFLAMLAHELRNPLAAVANGLQLLSRQPTRQDDRAAELQVMALRQTKVLGRLVDDLLDMSRITHGKVELQTSLIDLRDCVRNAVQSARHLADDRGVALTAELPREPVWVDGDAVRLEQVAWNLLTNAAKYTDRGGSIRATVALSGLEVTLRVSDSGIGLAPDKLPYVFDLFVQVDQSEQRSRGGLGLGLTMVRTLVERHGGRVAAHSDGLGEGSEFVVTLPRAPAPAVPSSPSGPVPGEPAAGVAVPRRLVLIEDNPDVGDTLRELLEMQGHTVELASCGPSGIEKVLATAPDAAIIDIGLPGMSGYEVAQSIRAAPGGNAVRLLALTGYGSGSDRHKALAAGFDAHLVKPAEPEEISSWVDRLCSAARSG